MTTPQCWLRPNLRALWLGAVVPTILAVAGLAMASGLAGRGAVRWIGCLVALVGVIPLAAILYSVRLPRLAYQNGSLLVYLRSSGPTPVPIDAVECFFLGQAAGRIPHPAGQRVKASTVVVRLAEAAKEWHGFAVKPAWGEWHDGYIIIRGTWCEPLDIELIKRLNRQLVEVQRLRRLQKESGPE